MSIYINGLKMPEKDDVFTLRIWGNGRIERLESYHSWLLSGVKAFSVPSHGDLIDRDMVLKKAWDIETFADAVKNAPATISAEREET